MYSQIVFLSCTGSYTCITYGPVHEILVLIAYVQNPLINAHIDIASEAKGLDFCLSPHLHPYLV